MSRGSQYPRRDRRRRDSADDSFAEVVNGFTFGSGRGKQRREPRREDQRDERPQADYDAYYHEGDSQEFPTNWQDFDEPVQLEDPAAPVASSIRSYTWTGGRTRANYELALETLVSVGENYQPGRPVRLEHQSIAELVQQPRSVAEVGALLSVPIGVARVLLADMAELGLVTVHHTVSESGSAPHMMLMERVLSGLRRL